MNVAAQKRGMLMTDFDKLVMPKISSSFKGLESFFKDLRGILFRSNEFRKNVTHQEMLKIFNTEIDKIDVEDRLANTIISTISIVWCIYFIYLSIQYIYYGTKLGIWQIQPPFGFRNWDAVTKPLGASSPGVSSPSSKPPTRMN